MSDELQFLDSLQASGIRPGLTRMRALLRAAGHPERAVPAVIVAGTNGKGSTAATLSAIFEAAGLRTGLYTSPHLIDLGERWRIGRESITEEKLIGEIVQLREVMAATSIHATYFEALTFIAYSYFARMSCDISVIEVGLGGRLDATNVIRPIAAVITAIGIDHVEYLGSTLPEIAGEKAGVIHRGSVVVTSNRDGESLEPIRARAGKARAPLHLVSEEVVVGRLELRERGISLELATPVRNYDLESPLAGEHQADNIAAAVRTAELLAGRFPGIDRRAIEHGVRNTLWRGRLERFDHDGRTLWVDGGHNGHALRRIGQFIDRFVPYPRLLVFGMMRDKDLAESAAILFPRFDSVIATCADRVRGLTTSEIEPFVRAAGKSFSAVEEPEKAVLAALASPFHAIVICGSLYLAGAAVGVLDRIGAS